MEYYVNSPKEINPAFTLVSVPAPKSFLFSETNNSLLYNGSNGTTAEHLVSKIRITYLLFRTQP